MPILLLYSKKLISPNVDLICSFQYRQMHWNWITARYWILFTKTSQQVNEYNAIFNRFSAGTKSHWRWNNPGYCRKPRALLMKFSTNHESLSQPIMKMGYWLHYFFYFPSCLTFVVKVQFFATSFIFVAKFILKAMTFRSWPYFKSSNAASQTRLQQRAAKPGEKCGKSRHGTIG